MPERVDEDELSDGLYMLEVYGSRAGRPHRPASTCSTAWAAVSICSAVTPGPRVKRTAVWETSAGMPRAVSTWEGSSLPAAQAEPEEATTPHCSRSSSTDSPLMPGKQKEACPGRRSPGVSTPGPVSSTSSRAPSTRAMKASRSFAIRPAAASRSGWASSRAAARATAKATFSVPERRPFSCPPPWISGPTGSRPRMAATPMRLGAPTLWPEMLTASAPSPRRSSQPADCTASVCSSAPTSWVASARARTSVTAPISLSAWARETRVVSSRSTARRARAVTCPSAPTSTKDTSKPWACRRCSMLASTASCSIGEVTRCLPRGAARARPLIARFAASVPPAVKVMSLRRMPSTAATRRRASSRAAAAGSPRLWWLEGCRSCRSGTARPLRGPRGAPARWPRRPGTASPTCRHGDVQAEVEHRGAVGQGSRGDHVDPGAGDLPDRVQGDGPAGFDEGAPGDHLHPAREVLEGEVVEHDDVHSPGDHRLDLLERIDLDLEPGGVPQLPAGAADRLGEVQALLLEDGEVVVLGHHRIREGEAVVDAPSAAHGVAFEGAQPRCGLAGVGDARAGAHDGVDEAAGQGRDPAHALQEVQGDPFGLDDGAGRAAHDGQLGAGREAVPVGRSGADPGGRVGEPERGGEHVQAGQDAVLAGAQLRGGGGVGGQEHLAGEVAPGGVLGERSAHDAVDLGGGQHASTSEGEIGRAHV